jgi:hypothetical protein
MNIPPYSKNVLQIGLVGLVVTALAVLLGADYATANDASPVAKAKAQETFGKLPLSFIENRGQLDARVAYYVQGADTTVYFTSDGVTFALTGQGDRPTAPDQPVHQASMRPAAFGTAPAQEAATQRWAVKLDFVGANPAARPQGQDPTPAVISYFKGPRAQWKTGLRTHASLVYSDLWPGIDLVYSGTVNRLKYTFVVKPGADPQRIKLAYRGATAVRLTDAGELEVSTPAGGFRDERPYAYQEINGRRVEVAAAYALAPQSPAGVQGYSFSLGPYDQGKPLVLDPAVLVYAGYIGGSGSDTGQGIAVDSAGNAYVTGVTQSTEATFPETIGPDLTYNGAGCCGGDAFVAKVNAAGTALLYAGYIGGSSDDEGRGIAVDSAGNAYVTGFTSSSEAQGFPVTVGPDLTFNGNFDAFVAKVNALGTGLLYAGYIGGAGSESGQGIAVDSAGNAYVTGFTSSSEAQGFPVTVGPDLTFNGNFDAFVAKVNALGTGLLYAGYIGGGRVGLGVTEAGFGIAVDGLGNAYVTGSTSSSEAEGFPVTVGPDLTFNGNFDAFVAKVNALGTGLLYAGYIGGAGSELGRGIAVDGAGNAYVTGFTGSSEATFPVTVGPDLTYNGNTDAFVAKVNAAGTALLYAGYIGGSSQDQGFGIAVDSAGNAYVTGDTSSTEATFPVTGGPDTSNNGGFDAFVAKVNAAGTALLYAGYIGGSSQDQGFGIAVDSAGNAYVTGATQSSEATFPVTGGPDLTFNGFRDAFVAKVVELPPTTPGCEITILDNGVITAANFDRATFNGDARSSASGETEGDQRYRDHGPAQPLIMQSINVLSIVCENSAATIFGQATIDGAGSHVYEIRVTDGGDPGRGQDKYQIILPSVPYDSGEQFLEGGNVIIRQN